MARADLTAAPFSAHPLTDRDGSVWNVGALLMLGGNGVLVWRIAPDGTLADAGTVPDAGGLGYLHSFAMTERHLVLLLTPYRVGDGGAFFERLRFAENAPARIAVVPKDDLSAARWYEADFAAVYHFADAIEKDGVIETRLVRHGDVANARSPAAAAMRGAREPVRGANRAMLSTLRIDTRKSSARATWHDSGVTNVEFPVAAYAGAATFGPLFAPTTIGRADADYFDAVAAIDPRRGRVATHRYGDTVMAEEHVFVPKRGGRAGQGWLIGTLLDYGKQRSGLAVLDAEHVADGPLATAWVDYVVPLGFHGAFGQA